MCRLALAVALATAAASPAWAQSGTGQPSGLDSALSEIRQLRDQKQWLPALTLIEQTAAKYPDDDALYVLRVHTLSEIGARERAWQLYQAKPQLFSADEAQRIELDRLARLTSTSEYFVADETRRLEEARAVEAANQDYLKRAGIDASQMPLRMRYDRLDLLNRLERHREVVEEYEKLRAEGHDIPGYAMIPIGASLMDQKRPKEAIPVLEKAIEAIPDDNPKKVQYKIMHAYALMEAERFDLAQPELKALVEANPDWRTVPGAPLPYENWDRYHAEVNEAMVRSYAGDLTGAQKTLETMSVYGPDDSGVQSSLGSIYDRRGWHERALERHRIASTLDPQSIDARTGQVESLLELQRVEQARPIYNELQTVYPDTLQSRTLRDRWNQNVGWQWRAFAAWGRSDSDGNSNVSPVGSRDGVYGIEAETPLLGDRWRLTAGYADRYADFNDRRIHDRRGAFGVRYTYDRLDLHLQANRSHDDLDNTGASLDVGWRFSDVFDAGLTAAQVRPGSLLAGARVRHHRRLRRAFRELAPERTHHGAGQRTGLSFRRWQPPPVAGREPRPATGHATAFPAQRPGLDLHQPRHARRRALLQSLARCLAGIRRARRPDRVARVRALFPPPPDGDGRALLAGGLRNRLGAIAAL